MSDRSIPRSYRMMAGLAAMPAAANSLTKLHAALLAQGAVPRWVAPRLGAIATAEGGDLQADASLENEPGFLFDALVLPDGTEAVQALARDAHTMEFVRDQYRHCKSILAIGASKALLRQAGVPEQLPGGAFDPGLVIAAAVERAEVNSAINSFLRAIARHRHPDPDPAKLRQAVSAEKEAIASSLVRYKALTAKITAYQSSEGPEPTEAEFLQWRDDVKLAIRLKKLQSGLLES